MTFALRPNRRWLFIVLSALVSGSFGDAQQCRFRHCGHEDGLQNLAVTALVQDHTGYLWTGTETWLFRYDGTRFRTFEADTGLPGPCQIDTLAVAHDNASRRHAFGAGCAAPS